MSGASSCLGATADAYDAVAVRYAEFARDELDALPLDRAVLAAFVALARTTGSGPVAELWCGPGRVTAHLRDLSLDVFGVDLSPVMIDLARRAYPDLWFEVGSMDALDLADGELNGIVSWYSVIHVPPQDMSSYFAEFRRVLAAGGHLLLASSSRRASRSRRSTTRWRRPTGGRSTTSRGWPAKPDSPKSAGCCASRARRNGIAGAIC